MEEMNVDFNDPESTPPASGVPDSLTEWQCSEPFLPEQRALPFWSAGPAFPIRSFWQFERHLLQISAMTDRPALYESRASYRPREMQRHYHSLLKRYYRFFVPPGMKVLEIGCGIGDLLNGLEPERGLGIDFSEGMISTASERHPHLEFKVADAHDFESDEKFDYIILSDLVNDLNDVQEVLTRLSGVTHEGSRIVLNFFNHLWLPILKSAEKIGLKSPTPPQNWLSRGDLDNLLRISGWEMVKWDAKILWPIWTPLWEGLMNRCLAPLLRHINLSIFMVARPKVKLDVRRELSCTVVIPARNEEGNIEAAVRRTPEMGKGTEIIFIEGHSTDETWKEIQRVQKDFPDRNIRSLQQKSKGKGGGVREAFAVAKGDVLFILDADLTMPPEDLPKFYGVIQSGVADFVNGVRLVYPMEDQAMRFFNKGGNKFFSLAFSWLLGQPIKDSLCGTKVLFRSDYRRIEANRKYFGDFDPFGDFDLLFGAAKLNLQLVDLPIRYRARTYGDTNIQRWRHGVILLRMVVFAARKIKFI